VLSVITSSPTSRGASSRQIQKGSGTNRAQTAGWIGNRNKILWAALSRIVSSRDSVWAAYTHFSRAYKPFHLSFRILSAMEREGELKQTA
jgi:hypothetical protein